MKNTFLRVQIWTVWTFFVHYTSKYEKDSCNKTCFSCKSFVYKSSKTCNSLSLDSIYRKRNENFVERCVQEHAEYYIQYTMNQSGFVKNCQYLERNSNRIRQKILHEVLSIKIKLAYNMLATLNNKGVYSKHFLNNFIFHWLS